TITKEQAEDLWAPWIATQGTTLQAYSYGPFPIPPLTCDQLLEYEETLVCMADELAQLADAVAPQTWAAVQYLPGITGPLTWVIPPPAENEKFIVRDLAMEVL